MEIETTDSFQNSYIVAVSKCQRCGNDHPKLRFRLLANPIDDYTHWAMCPHIDEPLVLRMVVKKYRST